MPLPLKPCQKNPVKIFWGNIKTWLWFLREYAELQSGGRRQVSCPLSSTSLDAYTRVQKKNRTGGCIGWARTGIVERESRKPHLQPSPLCSLWSQTLNFLRKRTVQCRHETNNTLTCRWGTESMLRTEHLEHSIITAKAMRYPWIETAVPSSSRDWLTAAMTFLPFLSHPVLVGWWVTYGNWQTGMDGRRGSEGEFSLGKQTEQQQQQNIRKVKNTGESNIEGKTVIWNIVLLIMPKTAKEKCQEETAKWDVRSTNFPLNKHKSSG